MTELLFSEINLGMGPANERRRYIVTPPLIGWAHTQNDAWFSPAYAASEHYHHHVIVQLHLELIQRHGNKHQQCHKLTTVPLQAGKLKFFGTRPNWVVSYIAYTKFHSARPVFHLPGQIFTPIGERVSASFRACLCTCKGIKLKVTKKWNKVQYKYLCISQSAIRRKTIWLTQWGQDKMATILQTTFSNAFHDFSEWKLLQF